jgi:hypothetical protein
MNNHSICSFCSSVKSLFILDGLDDTCLFVLSLGPVFQYLNHLSGSSSSLSGSHIRTLFVFFLNVLIPASSLREIGICNLSVERVVFINHLPKAL